MHFPDGEERFFYHTPATPLILIVTRRMHNVLIITPDAPGTPGATLPAVLRSAGYQVARAALDGGTADASTALGAAFESRPPHFVIADISRSRDCLPLRHIRSLMRQTWGDDMPAPLYLALMTAHHLETPDCAAYLDDFLLPPYAPTEVLARLRLLLFRHRHVRDGNTLTCAGVTLHLSEGLARDEAGKILPMTPREYDLLRFFCTHRGKFFARDRLVDLVWGLDFEGGLRTVDIHVRRLRAKLPTTTGELLETRRGVGYGLRAP